MEYPEHVLRNREHWGPTSHEWVQPGRKAWASEEFTWGCFGVPESEVHALGDLDALRGLSSIELGCGTGYISAWLARLGMMPTGIDITPGQLQTARSLQDEFDLHFPLIEGSAESVPLPDGSFDLAISEYGASIWCDPYAWIPEAARLLRPGGQLVFLRNSTVSTLCMPNEGPVKTELCRDYFGLDRIEWSDDNSVEFHLPTGPMLRLLRANGFVVEDLIELQAPASAEPTRFEYMNVEWAKRWPSEEIWRARKAS